MSEPEVQRPVSKSKLRELHRLSEKAYCDYIDQMKRPECLGYEQKLKDRTFGKTELDAHTQAGELLGKHRAFAQAAALADEIEREQAEPEWDAGAFIRKFWTEGKPLHEIVKMAYIAGRAAQPETFAGRGQFLDAIITTSTGGTVAWKCKANRTADPPQDCDWPMCGCDPYADKVIAAIQESNAEQNSCGLWCPKCGAHLKGPKTFAGPTPEQLIEWEGQWVQLPGGVSRYQFLAARINAWLAHARSGE